MAGSGRRNADEALALALATGQTLRDAATATGIGERTATRRMADPDFRSRVVKLRTEMVGRAVGKMADGMADAADTLRALLRAEGESVRLGASRALLELGVKLRESAELANRVDELERLLKGVDDEPGQAPKPATGGGAGAGPRPAGQGADATPDGT